VIRLVDTLLLMFQRLDEQDFDEKKEINRQKRLILQGKVRIFMRLSVTG